MDTRDRQIVHSFLARLELTVGWLELESLINAGIIPLENPKTGVWTSRLVKAARDKDRPISVLAHNVLKLARKGQNVVVSVAHLQEAKGIVRQAMDVYHPAVFA